MLAMVRTHIFVMHVVTGVVDLVMYLLAIIKCIFKFLGLEKINFYILI